MPGVYEQITTSLREKQAHDLVMEAAQNACDCLEIAHTVRLALSQDFLSGAAVFAFSPQEKLAAYVYDDVPPHFARKIAHRLQLAIGYPVAAVPLENFHDPEAQFIKVAMSPSLRPPLQMLSYFRGGPLNSPGPIQAGLSSALLGAGLGYGAGALGEQLLPSSWNRKKLRRTTATLGALMGVMPPAAWMYANSRLGLPLNSPELLNPPDGTPLRIDPMSFKEASGEVAEFGGLLRPIHVGRFERDIWHDPYIARQLPDASQTALSSAVQTAAMLPGGIGSGWVTPIQMGRLAAGMGAGYLSGALVGGLLGRLTGAPPAVQDNLKRTGVYAGALQAIVPKLFGL